MSYVHAGGGGGGVDCELDPIKECKLLQESWIILETLVVNMHVHGSFTTEVSQGSVVGNC